MKPSLFLPAALAALLMVSVMAPAASASHTGVRGHIEIGRGLDASVAFFVDDCEETNGDTEYHCLIVVGNYYSRIVKKCGNNFTLAITTGSSDARFCGNWESYRGWRFHTVAHLVPLNAVTHPSTVNVTVEFVKTAP